VLVRGASGGAVAPALPSASVPLFSFEGRSPQVHPEAWVAPTATLVGDVVVEAGASIWYGVVLRADFGRIVIRAGANVQDNSVLHGGADPETEVGPGATIGHVCVVHGAVIGAEALIGNGATVQDGARIGARALVGAHSLVPPGMEVPEEVMVLGAPARVRGPLSDGARGWVGGNPGIYQALARRHAAGITEVVRPL
jgi:carbonic anhydrase/acetyltransferase-like protein (isoleucine patch superfamily)